MGNTLTGGLIGGVLGMVIGWVFRHLHILLMMYGIYYVYHWVTSDPVVERHQIELQQEEVSNVAAERAKVTATGLVFDTTNYEATATVTNRSAVSVSDIWLLCKYHRRDHDKLFRISTPVAKTGFLAPGQSQRIMFDLRDMATDAMQAGAFCTPQVYLNEADLLKTKIVSPKHGRDELVANSDVKVSGRMGQQRLDFAPIVVEGSITNNTRKVFTKITVACSVLLNVFGRTETRYAGTSIYVGPGETKSFGFQTGMTRIENPKFGMKDISCRLLNLDQT